MKSSFKGTRLGSWTAGAAVLALALTGCTTTAPEDDRTPTQPADSVPFGASDAEWLEAFENVEPITLRWQTPGPVGTATSEPHTNLGSALEAKSGGKISIEWGYSNAFVPDATEWAAGLADGRMDIATFLPYYTPEVFPQFSGAADATFVDGNLPTATLVSSAWLTDVAYTESSFREEAEDNGVHVLTASPTANVGAIFCKEPYSSLADFDGAQISASGVGRVAQLTALGAVPQSIAFTELYEALERNVVSCGASTVTAINDIGVTELVPYATADPEAALVGFPVFLAIGKDRWDTLPLVAQQLIFDSLSVFIEDQPKVQSRTNVGWLAQVQALGGGIIAMETDAREAILERNESLLEEIGARGIDVDALVETRDRWFDMVNSELYPDVTTDLETFLGAGAFQEMDLDPFVDRFYEEILLPHRPE